MKLIKVTIPVLALLAFALVLSGCPGKDKMMGAAPAQSPAVHAIG